MQKTSAFTGLKEFDFVFDWDTLKDRWRCEIIEHAIRVQITAIPLSLPPIRHRLERAIQLRKALDGLGVAFADTSEISYGRMWDSEIDYQNRTASLYEHIVAAQGEIHQGRNSQLEWPSLS